MGQPFSLLLLLMLFVGRPALAAPAHPLLPAARQHLERGLTLYDRGRYDEAIAELRTGLAIDPQPDFLYALGQAERRRGDCERALEYYQLCLGLVHDPTAQAALRVQIERCRVQAGQRDSTRPAAMPGGEPGRLPSPVGPQSPAAQWTHSAPPPVAPRPAVRPWYRDPLGLTLASIGIAGLAAGGALIGVAHHAALTAGDSYQDYVGARAAPTLWTGGLVGLAVGGALALTGVLRLGLMAAHVEAY